MLSSDTIKYGAITLFLLWYVIKSAEKRESWLKKHIEKLDANMQEYVGVLNLMKVELIHKIETIEKTVDNIKGGE